MKLSDSRLKELRELVPLSSDTCVQLLDEIEQLRAEARRGGWVSVNEKMPKTGTYWIALKDGKVGQADFNQGKFTIGVFRYTTVTHWAEIVPPTPPESAQTAQEESK